MSNVSDHNWDDARQYLNGLEWSLILATRTLCPHCNAEAELLPMPGLAWGLDITHEVGCPDNYEDQP